MSTTYRIDTITQEQMVLANALTKAQDFEVLPGMKGTTRVRTTSGRSTFTFTLHTDGVWRLGTVSEYGNVIGLSGYRTDPSGLPIHQIKYQNILTGFVRQGGGS